MRQALRPGMPLPGPPHTSAVLRERLPQMWACPHSRARVLSVLPTVPSPVLWLSFPGPWPAELGWVSRPAPGSPQAG